MSTEIAPPQRRLGTGIVSADMFRVDYSETTVTPELCERTRLLVIARAGESVTRILSILDLPPVD